MKVYQVYYEDYNYINNNVYDDEGYHDDYYDEEIITQIPVKYFDCKNKAFKFINNNKNKTYYWKEILVE